MLVYIKIYIYIRVVYKLDDLPEALPEAMGCVALFNAKPAIIRAFLAATGRPSCRSDERAYREHLKDYVRPGEQFRKLPLGAKRELGGGAQEIDIIYIYM